MENKQATRQSVYNTYISLETTKGLQETIPALTETEFEYLKSEWEGELLLNISKIRNETNREVVYLTLFAGMKQREIASELELKTGEVGMRLQRGLKEFRKLWNSGMELPVARQGSWVTACTIRASKDNTEDKWYFAGKQAKNPVTYSFNRVSTRHGIDRMAIPEHLKSYWKFIPEVEMKNDSSSLFGFLAGCKMQACNRAMKKTAGNFAQDGYKLFKEENAGKKIIEEELRVKHLNTL